MRVRQVATGLLASLTTLIMITPSAHAAADPVGCTIVDVTPGAIVLGTTPKLIHFDVGTDCDDTHPVSWSVQAENYRGSAHVSWLGVCNYQRPPDPSVFDCAHQGATTMSMVGTGDWTGNDMAGTVHPLYSYAFYDADGDNSVDSGESADRFTGHFTLLRQTTFGSSFQVGRTALRRGQKLGVSGQIQRANWDVGHYEKFRTHVTLQFRPAGAQDYQDVKQVWDNGVNAATTVKVTRSGHWRYYFTGATTDAPSFSASQYVRVYR